MAKAGSRVTCFSNWLQDQTVLNLVTILNLSPCNLVGPFANLGCGFFYVFIEFVTILLLFYATGF